MRFVMVSTSSGGVLTLHGAITTSSTIRLIVKDLQAFRLSTYCPMTAVAARQSSSLAVCVGSGPPYRVSQLKTYLCVALSGIP